MSLLLSKKFKLLKDDLCHADFTTSQLLEKLGDKSHSLAIIILSLPFLLLMPVPGLSTILGLMICWIVCYWLINKKIWLPRKWGSKPLSARLFLKVFEHGEKYSAKIERLFKARGEALVQANFVRFFVFLLIIASALFLALPLPPGTNFPPALTLIVLALGILFDDLILIIIGVLVFALNAVLMFMAVKFMWTQSLPFIESYFK